MKTSEKEKFIIHEISKSDAKKILDKYHYLSKISKGFKSGYNFGLFTNGELVGVSIFTGFPVPELSKGMFGLDRDDQDGLFELSRLCLSPAIQNKEHNLASWFLSRAMRELRKKTNVRAILSYADSDFHQGVVYAASNFKYYGMTESKKDFFFKNEDGTYTKHSRGKVKGIPGEWRERARKHRFVIIYDKKLQIKWEEVKWKNLNNQHNIS